MGQEFKLYVIALLAVWSCGMLYNVTFPWCRMSLHTSLIHQHHYDDFDPPKMALYDIFLYSTVISQAY